MSTTASVLSAQFYIRAIRPFSVLGICTYICESSFELTYFRSQFFGTCKLASGLSQARLHMPKGECLGSRGSGYDKLGHRDKGVTPRRCNAGDLAACAEAAHHSLCIRDVFILLPPGSSELFSNQQAS